MPTYCPVEFYGSGDGIYYYRCRVCEDCSYQDASSSRSDHGLGGCPECNDPGPCDPILMDAALKILEVTKGTHACGIGNSGPLADYSTPDRRFKTCCIHIRVTEYYAHYEDNNGKPRKAKLFAGRAVGTEHNNFALGQELSPSANIAGLASYFGPDKTKFLSKGITGYCHLIEVTVAPNRKIKFHVHLKTA